MPTEALHDASGRMVARYELEASDGRPMADSMAAEPGVPAPAVVAAAVTAMPGWLLATQDAELGAAFEAAGARFRRRSHLLSLDLCAAAAPAAELPPGLRLEPAGRVTDELVDACFAAYGPAHPDHFGSWDAEAAELRRIVSGEEVGPLLACSRVAWFKGRQVGAALMTDSGGEPPRGGPRLAQLFRAPDEHLAGVGTVLLAAAVAGAQADGLATLGLLVSAGNPAHELYRRVGFEHRGTTLTLLLPGDLSEPVPDSPGG